MARPEVSAVPVMFLSSHSQLGGSERYLEQILARIGDGWVAGLVCLEDGPFVARARELGVPVTVIPAGSSPPGLLAASRKLRSFLAASTFSVLHANGVKAALVAALARTPRTIWLKHDFSWDGWLTRGIARRCALVVGVSDAVLESVRDSARTAVAYNGLDPQPVDEAQGRAIVAGLVGGDGPVAVLVGRLHPVKGHIELVEAAPTILEKNPQVRFLFVGGADPNTPEHEAIVRRRVEELKLADRVTFAGHRDDIAEISSGADVAVMPSVRLSARQGREGFPLVGLEMMAAGTPVIAYADGGVPELLGDCGVLVTPGDRRGLATAIVDLLADRDRYAALATCGRSRVRDHFTFDSVVATMQGHYRDVASS